MLASVLRAVFDGGRDGSFRHWPPCLFSRPVLFCGMVVLAAGFDRCTPPGTPSGDAAAAVPCSTYVASGLQQAPPPPASVMRCIFSRLHTMFKGEAERCADLVQLPSAVVRMGVWGGGFGR